MLTKKDDSICRACGELVVLSNKRGVRVCTNCGLVKEDRFIDPQTEYRVFQDESNDRVDPRRVGKPVKMHLDSQIDLIEIDKGKPTYHQYSPASNSDKRYGLIKRLMIRYGSILDIREDIIRVANSILYDVIEETELKGKRREVLAAAILYLACKRSLINIHPKAFEPIVNVDFNRILKYAKIVLRYIPTMKIKATQYTKMFCRKLNIKKKHMEEMVLICKEIEKWDIFESRNPKPRTIAASVINFYLTFQDQYSIYLDDIKMVSGIADNNTIQKYYNSLETKFSYLQKELNLTIGRY